MYDFSEISLNIMWMEHNAVIYTLKLVSVFLQIYFIGNYTINLAPLYLLHLCICPTYRWVPLKPDFLGAWKSVWLKHNLAYPIIIISLIIQGTFGKKSGLSGNQT